MIIQTTKLASGGILVPVFRRCQWGRAAGTYADGWHNRVRVHVSTVRKSRG